MYDHLMISGSFCTVLLHTNITCKTWFTKQSTFERQISDQFSVHNIFNLVPNEEESVVLISSLCERIKTP